MRGKKAWADRRKKPHWVIVLADTLGCIDENRVLDGDAEPVKNLLDELQCPVADEVLIALRKSFSLTYRATRSWMACNKRYQKSAGSALKH